MRNKIINGLLLLATGILLLAGSNSCIRTREESGSYPIQPVVFTSVTVNDQFWAPRIKTNHEVTIPIAFGYCESTGRIRNFEIAGGLDTGRFQTIYPFDDSDVYKIIEGASYSLQTFPDKNLESYLDTLISKIAAAQEDDGYLYTNRTIAELRGESPHPWATDKRWAKTNILSHELYNIGHMYEAAVAHYQATGKRTLLDVAIRSADLVCRDFGWDRYVNYPGHQEIEIGLVKLYNVTGERKYLEMAKFFLDARGKRDDGEEYSQSHMKVADQDHAVGHAVRATYMYSAMADIAAIMNDKSYIDAVGKIWEDIVNTKLYVTGGIGASAGNEGFGESYELPNMTAYCETCASVGFIFTNYRLFLETGDSKYFDVLERTLYNSMLSGVSLSGDRFFYPNPLESEGQHERKSWFGCACCPSNVARFIPSLPGYIYATSDSRLYVNLFISNKATVDINGKKVSLTQTTDYPWDGVVDIVVGKSEVRNFILAIRVPGWSRNEAVPGGLYKFTGVAEDEVTIKINGEPTLLNLRNGYAEIDRHWKEGDRITLELPMEIGVLEADARVADDIGMVAFQRGPLVYCAEWADNEELKVREVTVPNDAETEVVTGRRGLGGSVMINTQVSQNKNQNKSGLSLIPYYLWNNRGAGDMRVWIPKGQ